MNTVIKIEATRTRLFLVVVVCWTTYCGIGCRPTHSPTVNRQKFGRDGIRTLASRQCLAGLTACHTAMWCCPAGSAWQAIAASRRHGLSKLRAVLSFANPHRTHQAYRVSNRSPERGRYVLEDRLNTLNFAECAFHSPRPKLTSIKCNIRNGLRNFL